MKKNLLRFFLSFLVFCFGCGKEGYLIIPSDKIPSQISKFYAEARSGNVHLYWEIPDKNTDDSNLDDLWFFEIRRYFSNDNKTEPSSTKSDEKTGFFAKTWKSMVNSIIPEKNEIQEEYVTFKLSIDDIPDRYKKAKIGYFVDYGYYPKSKGKWFGNTCTYTVQAINKSKKKGEQPAQRAAVKVDNAPNPPDCLKFEPHNKKVILSWSPPYEDIMGKNIDEKIFYNVFRSETCSVYLAPPINESPLTDTTYTDTAVENYKDYFYIVRALFEGKNYSDDSPEIQVQAFDDTIPTPPKNLKAVPSIGGIMLLWDKNTDPDIAGYYIYRKAKSEKKFKKINSKPVTKPSFVDSFTYEKTLYFYYVTAIDNAKNPNESKPSNTVQSKLVSVD